MSPTTAEPASAALRDRKSTRLNSSHTEIYTLSLHDALPISQRRLEQVGRARHHGAHPAAEVDEPHDGGAGVGRAERSEEHTSELQSHRDLHSFPTRRSSDLSAPPRTGWPCPSPWRSPGCRGR